MSMWHWMMGKDDCADSPCALNATCVDLVNDYECQCPRGFKGKRCSVKEDLCSLAPCVHGLCVDTMFARRCICEEGWTGENCDVNIDDCASQPCQNGGTCTDEVAGFSCACPAGYRGVHCQHLVDHCSTSPCRNNATCTNLGASYHCACPLGFDGTHCEHNKDECLQMRCDKNGTESCEDGINSFSCVCKPGYRGEFCEVRIDQCASSPCMNNGTCYDEGGSYRCQCAIGWTGETCEQETGSCDSRPCRNDGRCVNLIADYFCVCPEGVSGKDCEIAPNRCLGEPCLNGGVCGDFGSRQECTCPKKFTGAGCQYLQDPCAESVCQNGGKCNRTSDGGFHCTCEPGFTGAHCETNVDDCARSPCPIGATCIDQINAAYCRCPFNMTGANCDKEVDEDYDLHFFDSLHPASASLALPFLVETKAITLSLWVKFDQAQSKGRVLTMYSSEEANYSTGETEVLRVDSEGVSVALFANETALQLHFPTNQKINDGAWNHLVFTWTSEKGGYSLIWNSVRIFVGNGYGTGQHINMNALIALGSNEAGELSFGGSVTRVHLWSRVLDFDSEIPMMVVSCHGSENCPQDHFVVTSEREVNVTWPEPEFVSKYPLEKVERNFKQGQVFTWGEYDVLYVARDNTSNTAECNFKIHVLREHCPQLEEPVNGVQACESWGPQLRFKACSIECRDGYEFPILPAIFYTCAADGLWRPRHHNQLTFRYPQCTKSVPATRVVLSRVAYRGSSPCSEASRDALRTRLLASIQTINQKWDICSLTDLSGCVGARVDVDCSLEEFGRVKRESNSFNVRIEIPVKRDPVTNSVSGQKSKVVDALQSEIINQGAFNLEKVLPNGRPDLSSFQLSDEFHCQVGQVNVGDLCVPCAPGSFHSAQTARCELCPEGEYQPLSGRTECFKCQEGRITAGQGAINENECKDNCEPGSFFDMATSQCEPCGFGFFQPRSGSFECIACGVGKTTMSERATGDDECRDECPDGEQLSSSGSCQSCPSGSYRTRGEHKQCMQCPTGTTTESVGAIRREQCNTPLCKPGQFLVKESKHCQFCPRGTFQDEEQHTTCKLCPVDHTTAAQGATAESQCYSTNQCATGEDNCSWHAHCIDLPDDNDVPSFQCKCKPGFRGNGTYCQDACTNYCLNDGVCKKNPVGYVECVCKENFSGERCEVRFQPRSQRIAIITAGIGGVVAVLVVIVIVIFMISFRFNRSEVELSEKVQIDDLQQSNFLYGRPALEAPRPVGYYYEDDDEYESKTVYASRDDDAKEIEHRRRLAQQHMYRPGQTE
ncbi:hypothetical protein Q1695_006319 [Nippostrongylus brasiliensis]|nr:hypothetical protein Q1695_006319 [Nippostrongylus brasiliensis]